MLQKRRQNTILLHHITIHPLQHQAQSHKEHRRHQAGRVLLGQAHGGIAGRGGRAASGRGAGTGTLTAGAGRGLGGQRHGRAGGRRGRRSIRGVQLAALVATLGALLVLVLSGGARDALAVVGVADKEGDGLLVGRDIGLGAVGALAAELQRLLWIDQWRDSPVGKRRDLTVSQVLAEAAPPQILGQELRCARHQAAVDDQHGTFFV